MLIRVEHGKGAKDRYAMLSECLLEVLRAYFRLLRPAGPWLFPSCRYRSCRNRHCPKCQGATREKWLQQRTAELLPAEYFHVVFTLPQSVAGIAFHNKEVGLRSPGSGNRFLRRAA
jgi:hypothetical protein